MNVKTQYYLWLFLAAPIGVFLFGSLSAILSQWFLIGVFIWIIFIARKLAIASCPKCGAPIAGGERHLGIFIFRSGIFVPKKCGKCGYSYDTHDEND